MTTGTLAIVCFGSIPLRISVPLPYTCQQVVSLSQSSPFDLSDVGVGGGGGLRRQIIRQQGSLVFYNLLTTLCSFSVSWDVQAPPARQRKERVRESHTEGEGELATVANHTTKYSKVLYLHSL
jgi:hypothetical protein